MRGFQTGDIVRAIVPGGKKAGVIVGNVQTTGGVVEGIGWQYRRVLHHDDGYAYAVRNKKGSVCSPCLKAGVSALSV